MSRINRAYRVTSLGVTVTVCATSADRASIIAGTELLKYDALRNRSDIKVRRAYDMDAAAQDVERMTVMHVDLPGHSQDGAFI